MRIGLVLSLLLFSSILIARQQPSGTWVMAYSKARQPVLSATMEQGELVFDKGTPFDSSEVYTPGLMVLQFGDARTAKSYSWDGNENWRWRIIQDSLLMFGQRDTLYGRLSTDEIVLSSTIDAVPTEYTFLKVESGLSLTTLPAKAQLELSIDEHVFDGQRWLFQKDTVYAVNTATPGQELFLTTLEPLQVVEYAIDKAHGKVELGIIYLFQEKRKRYVGLFYPVVDDFTRPKARRLNFRLK
ncbi:hypothetical protein [uncultured Roseivirga sp.]|uniref:hypothetical protein n=2 Tax=Roseivirga TaxID=290180 RepID=UPI00258AEFED|nr:hypothetical protein [uncultured Roseivirga sp.]MEC7755210.1 hypothetical protein [Bacteroidota bacterium]